MTKRSVCVCVWLVTCLLTGCWDKIELENRGFVNAMAIDAYTEKPKDAVTLKGAQMEETPRLLLHLSLPNLEAFSKGGAEEKQSVKTAAAATLPQAMGLIDLSTSQKPYFGHTKAAVFGTGLLEQEGLFRETIDALERNREVGRKIMVFATDGQAEKILSSESPGEPIVGMFLADYYKDEAERSSLSYKLDLQSLIGTLGSEGDALIPKIGLQEEQLSLAGAAIMKNFKLVGWLNDRQTRGMLMLKSQGKGAQLSLPYAREAEEIIMPVRINKFKCKLSFSEENGRVLCHATVKASAAVEGFSYGNQALQQDEEGLALLGNAAAQAITQDMTMAFDMLQSKGVDGLGLWEMLRKHAPQLYKQVENDRETTLKMLVFRPEVKVTITGAGSVN